MYTFKKLLVAVVLLFARPGVIYFIWNFCGLGNRIFPDGPLSFTEAGYWNTLLLVMVVQVMTAQTNDD